VSAPRFHQLRSAGHASLDQAISLEQQAASQPGAASRAIGLYYQGIASLEEALALPFTPSERYLSPHSLVLNYIGTTIGPRWTDCCARWAIQSHVHANARRF